MSNRALPEHAMISKELRRHVADTLRGYSSLEDLEITQVLDEIEREAQHAALIYDDMDTAKTRDELVSLRDNARRLIDSIDGASVFANFALFESAEASSESPYKMLGRIRRDCTRFVQLASSTLKDFQVKRGSPPNTQARNFAFHVARIFENYGIKPNSTKDGVYLAVLEQLFVELMPTEGGAAAERYGRWALKQELLEEVFFGIDDRQK